MASFLTYTLRSYRRIKKASAGSPEGLAWKCMLENVTYRLDQPAANSRLLALKQLVRTLRIIWKKPSRCRDYDRKTGVAILEAQFVYMELEEQSMLKQAPVGPETFISKSHLAGELSSAAVIPLMLFSFPIVIRTFFSKKHRMNLSMHIMQVAENAGLLAFCARREIAHVYDFAPYLIDDNWTYLLLKEKGIKVTKLPSPGPLATHHGILLADELVLSTPYQEEELSILPNIRVATHKKWLLESAFRYIDQYAGKQLATPDKTIGFYSHGGWLRAAEGHTDDGLNIPEAEHRLLEHLAHFVTQYPEYKVHIYPHPREKKKAVWEDTKRFYASFFEEGQCTLAAMDAQTTLSFAQTDIAVAAFSTILYERIFCGFKTLIGNYGIEGFPFPGSSLEGICFNTEEQLHQLLPGVAAMNADNYFQSFGLEEYHYSAYPYFSRK